MAWVTVISFNVILIALTLYRLKAGLIGPDEVASPTRTSSNATPSAAHLRSIARTRKRIFNTATYLMAAITVFALLFTLPDPPPHDRHRGVKVARVIAAMPPSSSPRFPSCSTPLWLAACAIYLYACGDSRRTTGNVSIVDETLQYMSLYHLFGIFWTTQFIAALGHVHRAPSLITGS